MPCKDNKKNNTHRHGYHMRSAADRMYHDSETFLYRYRGWIILILAVLLIAYLLTRKCEPGLLTDLSSSATGTVQAPKLTNELNIAEPATVAVNTEARK